MWDSASLSRAGALVCWIFLQRSSWSTAETCTSAAGKNVQHNMRMFNAAYIFHHNNKCPEQKKSAPHKNVQRTENVQHSKKKCSKQQTNSAQQKMFRAVRKCSAQQSNSSNGRSCCSSQGHSHNAEFCLPTADNRFQNIWKKGSRIHAFHHSSFENKQEKCLWQVPQEEMTNVKTDRNQRQRQSPSWAKVCGPLQL